jgi:predicted membrane channel-forming protein YqfA (hemolysin III family)
MKKILPYILLIAASYLAVAFVVNDINSTKWHWSDRLIVTIIALCSIALYLAFPRDKKD